MLPNDLFLTAVGKGPGAGGKMVEAQNKNSNASNLWRLWRKGRVLPISDGVWVCAICPLAAGEPGGDFC